MTEFEKLCDELNVPITLDEVGFYSGMCRALACICCDAIMNASGDTDLDADIKTKFYAKFPYMNK